MPIECGKYYCDDSIPRVAVDLDGVLYPGGAYEDDWSFDKDPIPGAMDWLASLLREGFEVLIFTSRMCTEPHTKHANPRPKEAVAQSIKNWILRNLGDRDTDYNRFERLIIYPPEYGKPGVKAFIDDHAVRHFGQYPDVEHLKNLEPWWRENPVFEAYREADSVMQAEFERLSALIEKQAARIYELEHDLDAIHTQATNLKEYIDICLENED